MGDPAPAFEASDEQGNPWKSADHVGKKYLVIYFYPGRLHPRLYSPGEELPRQHESVVRKGRCVVGVSGDSATTHALFKKVADAELYPAVR